MSQVNGITPSATNNVYSTLQNTTTKTADEAAATTNTAAAENKTTAESSGVVLELGSSNSSSLSPIPTKPVGNKDNTSLINKLKAETEAQKQRLLDLVKNLISGQGKAIGTADNMWSFLASGDFEVDAATKAQAQEDISEDGYWGVEATSERIVDFAKALTNGDSSKIDTMIDAFKKGFEQATETWGGKLPEISQKTYDAVLEKFEKWRNESSTTTEVIEE